MSGLLNRCRVICTTFLSIVLSLTNTQGELPKLEINSTPGYSNPLALVAPCASGAPIGGSVFIDYDSDGIDDGNSENAFANIEVQLFGERVH